MTHRGPFQPGTFCDSADHRAHTGVKSGAAQELETSFVFVRLFCSVKERLGKDGIRACFSIRRRILTKKTVPDLNLAELDKK